MTKKENDVHDTSTEEKTVTEINSEVAAEDKEAQKAIAKAKAHAVIDEADDFLLINIKETEKTKLGIKLQQQVVSFGRVDRLARGMHSLVTEDKEFAIGFKMAVMKNLMGM